MSEKILDNEQFASMALANFPKDFQFRPFAEYIAEGDCIQVITKEGSYYGERIDHLLTLFFSNETDEPTGFLIKGVSKLTKTIKPIKGVFENDKIKISYLIVMKMEQMINHFGNNLDLVKSKALETFFSEASLLEAEFHQDELAVA